jgi:hypothetical protein
LLTADACPTGGVGESDLNLSVERLIDLLDDAQRPLLTPYSPGSSGV